MPRVTFRLEYPEAKSVAIAGNFNEWNPETHLLRKTKKGYWSTTITLPRGRYEYRYFIDGQWFTDPNTEQIPNEFGSFNSIIVVE
ncbi:MAG: glycogen-binding domain-containing protein [Atribacterota bacterium]